MYPLAELAALLYPGWRDFLFVVCLLLIQTRVSICEGVSEREVFHFRGRKVLAWAENPEHSKAPYRSPPYASLHWKGASLVQHPAGTMATPPPRAGRFVSFGGGGGHTSAVWMECFSLVSLFFNDGGGSAVPDYAEIREIARSF